MKFYEKPVVEATLDAAEVVCADGSSTSADVIGGGSSEVKVTCRFGRTEASAGADVCQTCSKSNGTDGSGKGAYRADFAGCIENLPIKES